MFYYILKELCKAKGVPLSNVLLELGMSKGNIANWRNGKTPSSSNLKKLADYFEKSTDFLIGNPNNILKVINTQLFKQNLQSSDLENYLNIDIGSFENWENRISTSFLDYLPEIADFFKVTISYLFGYDFMVEKSIINTHNLDDESILLFIHHFPKLKQLFYDGLLLSDNNLDMLLDYSSFLRSKEDHLEIEFSYGNYAKYIKD